MAYTTEEQDFQSFMDKVRQYLPLILTVIGAVLATYSAITWYKTYKTNKISATYDEFKRISLDSTQNSSTEAKVDLFTKFYQDHPDNALAVLGILDVTNTLAKEGKYEAAYNFISQIPENTSSNPEIVAITKAKILLELGRGLEGIPFLDTIKEGQWYINARALAGDIFYSNLKYEQAIAEYTKAKEYNSKLISEETDKAKLEQYNSFGAWIQSRINIVQSANKSSHSAGSKENQSQATETTDENK